MINPKTGRRFFPGPNAHSAEKCPHIYGYLDKDGMDVCGECGSELGLQTHSHPILRLHRELHTNGFNLIDGADIVRKVGHTYDDGIPLGTALADHLADYHELDRAKLEISLKERARS